MRKNKSLKPEKYFDNSLCQQGLQKFRKMKK